jgi:DHA1 family bicyclomycin/chloramphenicol resistance-like MFS transporter/DHA1 family 2-module integral membrane pump EmrD-like MFS transporter
MPTVYILILVLLASVMGQFATDIYLPSLPALSGLLGISIAQAQLTVTVFYLGYAVMQMITGPLCDRFGRRIWMLIGIGLFAIGGMLGAQAHSFTTLWIARILQGLGVGASGVANRAILFDIFEGGDYVRAVASIGIASTLASLVAPFLGSIIHEHYGWQMNFHLIAVEAFFLWLLIVRKLPETGPYALNSEKEAPSSILVFIFNAYQGIFCSASYWRYGLINMFGFSAFVVYLSVVPFVFQEDLGLTPLGYGQMIFFLAVAYVTGIWIGRFYVKKMPAQQLLALGNSSQLFGAALMLVFYSCTDHSVLSILLPMMCFVLGTGISSPSVTALLLGEFPNNVATAGAALGGLMTFGAVLCSGLSVWSGMNSVDILLIVLCLCAVSIRVICNGILKNRMINL